MDPNATLAKLLAAAATIHRLQNLDIAPGDDVDHDAEFAEAARDAADAAEALNGWIGAGGFVPDSWSGWTVPGPPNETANMYYGFGQFT